MLEYQLAALNKAVVAQKGKDLEELQLVPICLLK